MVINLIGNRDSKDATEKENNKIKTNMAKKIFISKT